MMEYISLVKMAGKMVSFTKHIKKIVCAKHSLGKYFQICVW